MFPWIFQIWISFSNFDIIGINGIDQCDHGKWRPLLDLFSITTWAIFLLTGEYLILSTSLNFLKAVFGQMLLGSKILSRCSQKTVTFSRLLLDQLESVFFMAGEEIFGFFSFFRTFIYLVSLSGETLDR